MKVNIKLNGSQETLEGPAFLRLLDALRLAGYTGTKEGCGEGECGACSVIINGQLVNSCLIPLAEVEGQEILTVEGLASKEQLSPLQQSFLKCGGAQCGICTPGMLMASEYLLRQNATPNREEIKEALAGNFCRCTGHTKIIESVENVTCQKNRGCHEGVCS